MLEIVRHDANENWAHSVLFKRAILPSQAIVLSMSADR